MKLFSEGNKVEINIGDGQDPGSGAHSKIALILGVLAVVDREDLYNFSIQVIEKFSGVQLKVQHTAFDYNTRTRITVSRFDSIKELLRNVEESYSYFVNADVSEQEFTDEIVSIASDESKLLSYIFNTFNGVNQTETYDY